MGGSSGSMLESLIGVLLSEKLTNLMPGTQSENKTDESQRNESLKKQFKEDILSRLQNTDKQE